MSAFLLCFAAWSAIALGMDRHHEDALGREGTARRLLHLRRAGWLLLLLSLWLAARPQHATLASLGVTAWATGLEAVPGEPRPLPATVASGGVTAWAVALSVAAVAVTAMVTWQPRRAPAFAGGALIAGLLAWALGW